MKKLLLVFAVVAAVVAVPAASAGGWATVGLSSLPAGTAAGLRRRRPGPQPIQLTEAT